MLKLPILVFLILATIVTPDSKAATILVWGDSLSAAYGMDQNQGWVSLLQDRLTEHHANYQVVNASVSGETTDGGLLRLPKSLELHQPDIVILELGGNDGLRGYPTTRIQENLREMINLSAGANAQILLVGMVLPPNYGRRYTSKFEQVFTDLASEYSLPFLPVLLEGVDTDRELIQRDGIHPTAEAQPKMLEDIWPVLEPMLSAP